MCPLALTDLAPALPRIWAILGWTYKETWELQEGLLFLPTIQNLKTKVFWKGADVHRGESSRRIKAQESRCEGPTMGMQPGEGWGTKPCRSKEL